MVIEGLHALKHAFRFGADIIDVRTRDAAGLSLLGRRLAPDVAPAMEAAAASVDEATFASLSPTPPPTGVIALARRPAVDGAALLRSSTGQPLVLLERPTHHGNIGAVVRVAAAADAAGVLVTGTHDPWHPASVRGGAGLQFALPVTHLGAEVMELVLRSVRPMVVMDPEGEPIRFPIALPTGSLLVFGSERSGVTTALLERADLVLSLPMRAGVSSLNLATSVAVTLYAAGHG